MAECVENRIDDGILSEGFGLETVFGHTAPKEIRAGAGAQHTLQCFVIHLLAEIRDRVVDRLDESVYFGFTNGRLKGFGDELSGYRGRIG